MSKKNSVGVVESMFAKIDSVVEGVLAKLVQNGIQCENGWKYTVDGSTVYNTNAVGYGTTVCFDEGWIKENHARKPKSFSSEEGLLELAKIVEDLVDRGSGDDPVLFLGDWGYIGIHDWNMKRQVFEAGVFAGDMFLSPNASLSQIIKWAKKEQEVKRVVGSRSKMKGKRGR